MFKLIATTAALASLLGPSVQAGLPAAPATASTASSPGSTADLRAILPSSLQVDATTGVSNPSAASVLAGMSLEQRVGQLFMVSASATGYTSGTVQAITGHHVGNVYLSGRSSAGLVSTRKMTDRLQRLSTTSRTRNVTLLVATDQEGGYVQVLSGRGISTIPTALTQGSWSTSTLRSRATTWSDQLRGAGVNLDLAPVLDVVSAAWAPYNQPIGQYDREYGHTSTAVTSKGLAFLEGMESRNVGATVKHFPTLGRVRDNTDTHSGVVDSTTTSTSTYLDPFRSAVDHGVEAVMVSTAYYSRIDATHPAAFSRTIITGLLRDQMGYGGVVISDDLGNAAQVQAWSPGARAVDFINAGGDIVLTGSTTDVPSMVDAVLAKAQSSSSFRAKVDASALRVLQAKHALGLLRHYSSLAVDGSLGPATASALQVYLRMPTTGSWDLATRMNLQRVVGTTIDGSWGPASQAALQDFLGISRDGSSGLNARTVAALQTYLDAQR